MAGASRGGLGDARPDCAESGYLLIPRLLGALDTQPSLAADLAARAAEVGRRSADANLRALGVLGHGMFMSDRPAAVAEMRRTLVPGGRAVISTPGAIQPMAAGPPAGPRACCRTCQRASSPGGQSLATRVSTS
jgi:hypothetical protein